MAATGRNSWRDSVISLVSLVAYATPGFWLGLMMIVIFSIRLGWLPTSGFDTVGAGHEGWAEVWDVGRHLVMPAVALALFYLALYARLMRASVLEQTGMDYVTTARAKGQTERRIMTGHVLRNALLPIVTLAGVQAGNLIGGSIVVETVFGWPGIGTLAFNALQSRDLNLLLAHLLHLGLPGRDHQPRRRRALFHARPAHGDLTCGAGFVRFARNRMALFGAAVLLCLLLLVAAHARSSIPTIRSSSPDPPLQPPGGRFLLGTDTLGRDVAAEIAYGARTSLIDRRRRDARRHRVRRVVGGARRLLSRQDRDRR